MKNHTVYGSLVIKINPLVFTIPAALFILAFCNFFFFWGSFEASSFFVYEMKLH